MDIDFEQMEERLLELQQKYSVAGMAAAITDREQVLWEKGFGVTSLEKPWDKVSPNTLFRVGSNTKIIVGICIMRLIEQGKLSLDDSIGLYLPWFHVADEETDAKITIRRLLSHTAGLPAEYHPDGPLDEDHFEDSLKKEIEQITLTYDPDDGEYLYSNVGIRLIAAVLEHITGKPFSELSREAVLDPLGMTRSTYDLREAATYELALPHSTSRDGNLSVEHFIHMNAVRFPAGGLFSCVHEMTALARIKLNHGAPLISEESFDKMCRPYVRMTTPQEGYYGLTLMKRKYGDAFYYGHTGSNPPYYSCIWTRPDLGLGICFTTNTEGGDKLTNVAVPGLFDKIC